MANRRYNSRYIQLRGAIKNNDKVSARNLIFSEMNINKHTVEGNSFLHWAIIKFKDLDIMTMLLNKGANVHAKNQHNLKPLDIAIQNDKTEAAILLIEKGALIGENLNALLLEAIEKNNHVIVKNVTDYGIHYNTSIDFSILFDAAISQGQAKILEHILPHYRFLEMSNKYIPRIVVIKTGREYRECVELLLKWNFTIDPTSNHDKDFVYGAVKNGFLEIVLELLKLGIDVNMINSNTRLSLLKAACFNKHHEIVENLLKHNACLNHETLTNTKILNDSIYSCNSSLLSSYDKNNLCGLTCLHIAVLNSDPIMIRLLLKYGAKIIDDPTFFNITFIAVKKNYEEIVRIFLDQGVNVNGTNAEGQTLLHYSIGSGSDEQDFRYNIAKMLLEKKAITHIQTPGNSLLLKAITNGHHKIAQLFLDYNADIQYINPDGDTLLHKAIENEFDVEFIKTLLNLNLPVNSINNAGQTPLHLVCKYKNDMPESIIELLLHHNANIEAVDTKGWTPLFYACEKGNAVAVKCLLNHYVNANHKDLEDLTPLYIASRYYSICSSNSEVVKLLLEYKVNVHCIDKHGKSAIDYIVENRYAELIKYLVNAQVNLNSVNKQGNTPLHVAILHERVDMIKSLIKYGANINILNKQKHTPLRNAIEWMSGFQKQFQKHRSPQSSENINSDNESWNTDDIEGEIIEYTKITNILKIQVIKLKVAGFKVNDQNLKLLNTYDDSNDESSDEEDMDYKKIDMPQLEVKCEQEIEKMRMENIGVNSMTFYDLLKKNIHFLSRYVKNKKIRHILDLEVYDGKFPLYIDIIRSRFRDAKFRYRLINSANKYFSANVCSQLADDCIDTVFSFLNIKEIKMFIRAMKPLNK